MTNEEINDAVATILRNSLLPAAPAQVERWRILARNIACVESYDEGIAFILRAIIDAEDAGREAKWPEDYKQYANRWRKDLGPKWRRRAADRRSGVPPAGGPDSGG